MLILDKKTFRIIQTELRLLDIQVTSVEIIDSPRGADCTTENSGHLVYRTNSKRLEMCEGSRWESVVQTGKRATFAYSWSMLSRTSVVVGFANLQNAIGLYVSMLLENCEGHFTHTPNTMSDWNYICFGRGTYTSAKFFNMKADCRVVVVQFSTPERIFYGDQYIFYAFECDSESNVAKIFQGALGSNSSDVHASSNYPRYQCNLFLWKNFAPTSPK